MNKSYYAVIPANVRYDNDLQMGARMLYGELTALSNEKGYCWATNSYFAELYRVSNKTVSRWIRSLENKGYIFTQMVYKADSKEIEERRIYINPMDKNVPTYGQKCLYPTDKNVHTPTDKNVHTPMDKNVQGNNTVSNTTLVNITKNIEDIESPSSKTDENSPREKTPYKGIVQAYNDICKSLPDVKVISDKRKDKMRVAYKELKGIDKFIEVFQKAEDSDFLSGRSGKWGGCNFDWIINYNNLIKVIEGTYDNRKKGDNDGTHSSGSGEIETEGAKYTRIAREEGRIPTLEEELARKYDF